MCVKIDFSSNDLPVLSLTAGILMPMAIDFRNGHKNMGIPETIARRIVGALCFAGCIVAEVTENIFRAALALILLLPSLLLPCCWKDGLPAVTMLCGAIILLAPVLIVDLALRNVYAFGQNIYKQHINEIALGEAFGLNCFDPLKL